MSSSLRGVLIESHVADAAIAGLFLGALELGLQAFSSPLWRIATYLVTVIAIREIPYFSAGVNLQDRFMLIERALFLLASLIDLGVAWLLAHWLYKIGPLKILSRRYSDFRRNLA